MYKDATDFIPQNLRFTPRTVLKKPPDERLGVFMCARGAVCSGADFYTKMKSRRLLTGDGFL